LEKNVLSSNETIKIRPEKNPVFLVLSWIWGILGFWLLLIPTFRAIKKTVQYCNTEYLVTDKRIMEKYGWLSTHTDEMLLTKIENIVVNYTFFGKIFNYGTVSIQGANRNNVNFTCIKNAEKLKREINDLI